MTVFFSSLMSSQLRSLFRDVTFMALVLANWWFICLNYIYVPYLFCIIQLSRAFLYCCSVWIAANVLLYRETIIIKTSCSKESSTKNRELSSPKLVALQPAILWLIQCSFNDVGIYSTVKLPLFFTFTKPLTLNQ